VVFRMHFNELLAKQEALAEKDQQLLQLRGIIDVLQAGGGGGSGVGGSTGSGGTSRAPLGRR
jgi:hypothetical protein